MLAKTICRASAKTTAAQFVGLTVLVAAALLGPTSLAQSTPAIPTAGTSVLEFPVVMRQNVVSGKTPAGTKVQAKLSIATLVHGVVIPQEATLSGEVTESAAKSATGPARLALRMDSAQWKNGAAPTTLMLTPKLYLTAWYYPAAMTLNEDSSDGIPDAAHGYSRATMHPGAGNSNAPSPPGSAQDSSRHIPEPPAAGSNISKHRVLMKNIESASDNEGAVTLTSAHSNIKLDKTITYVLAATDLLPAK